MFCVTGTRQLSARLRCRVSLPRKSLPRLPGKPIRRGRDKDQGGMRPNSNGRSYKSFSISLIRLLMFFRDSFSRFASFRNAFSSSAGFPAVIPGAEANRFIPAP